MTVATKMVSLGPGESQEVPFLTTPQEARVYQVSVNGLTGSFTAVEVAPFDPWVYDTDNSCYIELTELVKATNVWVAGIITDEQLLEVTNLWQNHTRNPACAEPPPPPTDYLTMTKDELYAYLINGSVSQDWWSLSDNDRRQLGLKIIQWWSVSIGVHRFYAKTKDGSIPWWNPYTNPQPDYQSEPGDYQWEQGLEATVAIRYALFTNRDMAPANLFYWHKVLRQWFPLKPDVCFNLPSYICLTGEWLNALQVKPSLYEFNNYIFFASKFKEILPGHVWLGKWWSTGEPLHISVRHVNQIRLIGAADLGDEIVKFCPPNYAVC